MDPVLAQMVKIFVDPLEISSEVFLALYGKWSAKIGVSPEAWIKEGWWIVFVSDPEQEYNSPRLIEKKIRKATPKEIEEHETFMKMTSINSDLLEYYDIYAPEKP